MAITMEQNTSSALTPFENRGGLTEIVKEKLIGVANFSLSSALFLVPIALSKAYMLQHSIRVKSERNRSEKNPMILISMGSKTLHLVVFMVEAAGVEPASGNTPHKVLHA